MHGPSIKAVAAALATLAFAVSGLTLLSAAPASARTICQNNGYCYNTSGAPIYTAPRWHHGYNQDYYRWHHRHYGENHY
ncbi:MAG: hypothetical protein ABSF67_13095 [Roseiarcus sp.]|jgi:hypothetical protein